MDQSEVGLKKAKLLAASRGVSIHTVCADLSDFEFEQAKWSGIVSIWAHTPPLLRADIHHRIYDSLKSGGAFILEAYTPDQLEAPGIGGPPKAMSEWLMRLSEIRKELTFPELEIGRETVRTVSEGTFHQGESAVVQILGVKL